MATKKDYRHDCNESKVRASEVQNTERLKGRPGMQRGVGGVVNKQHV